MNKPIFNEEVVEIMKNTNIAQLANELNDALTHDILRGDITVFDFIENYYRR